MIDTQPNESQQKEPLGYCPHCDYQLLSAGTCPECGRTIVPNRIRSQPRRQRLRNWARRITLFVCLVALILSTRWAIQNNHHYRLYTNRMLIDGYPKDTRASGEIKRRLANNDFDDDELEEIVYKSFTFEIELRTPRPRGIPLVYEVKYARAKGAILGWAYETPRHLYAAQWSLDDKPYHTYASGFATTSGRILPISTDCQHYDATIPSIGKHTLRCEFESQVAAFDPVLNSSLPSLATRKFKFEASTQFVVEDKSICELVECRETEADIVDLQDSLRLVVKEVSQDLPSYEICATSLSHEIHAMKNFGPTNRGGCIELSRQPVTLSPDSLYGRGPNNLFKFKSANGKTAICVILDLTHGFNTGAKAVYPFKLHWHIADLNEIFMHSQECDCSAECATPPDRITHIDDE